MKKTIALVGEDPNDTDSIINLLSQRYPDFRYVKLIKNQRGHNLDNVRTKNALKIESDKVNPFAIIFVRDADCLHTQKKEIEKRHMWHKNLSAGLGRRNLLLVNIYELEALIFADIEKFNRKYGTQLKPNKNVAYIKEPKEELMRATRNTKRTFSPSDCPDVFRLLDIDIVIRNCEYFRTFISCFETIISRRAQKG